MKCINKMDDISMWGNYDLPNGANLMIVFEKCNNATSAVTCKSEAEIRKWLKFKYFVGLINSRVFVQHKFEDERIQTESHLLWFPVSTSVRMDHVVILNRFTMQLNDSHFNLGSIT